MLLEFVVENFKSYKDETVFSMETGARLRRLKAENTHPIKDTVRVLKSAYIFGANAGGKTNLLQAITLLQRLVVRPTSDSADTLVWIPFANESKPTTFKVVFFKKKKKYTYLVRYDEKQVLQEELSVDDTYVFQRDTQYIFLADREAEKSLRTLRDNQLLLYWAQDKNIADAVMAFSWFKNDIINLTNTLDGERLLNNDDAKILKNPRFKEKLLAILRAADFNISDYILTENTSIKEDIKSLVETFDAVPAKVRSLLLSDSFKMIQLSLKHQMNHEEIFLPLQQESLGTQRFIQMLINILPEFTEGKLILLDEFDQSFHIEMIKVLMKLMNVWNASNQFIVTTHQFTVMDFDLRADQIYFADKNAEGVSEVYSVFDFSDAAMKRNDFDYKKRYLKGLYGGMQIVNYPLLASIFSDEDNRGVTNGEN